MMSQWIKKLPLKPIYLAILLLELLAIFSIFSFFAVAISSEKSCQGLFYPTVCCSLFWDKGLSI